MKNEKICSKCRKFKSLSEFYRQKKGKTSDCKECRKSRSKIWAEKNQEKISEYKITYNKKRNLKVYWTSWKEKNKQYYTEYYSKNKERQLQRNNKFRKENPERCKLYNAFYYGIKCGKIKRQYHCQFCKTDQCKIKFYHMDYSKPRNVIWACLECHKNIVMKGQYGH